MSPDPRLAPLFEPLTLSVSGLRLANRLLMAPMPTFAAEADGSASAEEIAYYARRSAGGIAAVVTAGCAVRAEGVSFAGQWRCDADTFTSSLVRVNEAIRAGGARAVLQIVHHRTAIEALSGEDARRLVASFARAARRARAAGFDAVEIHGGHRYLVQQFFSPATNARAWDWGGTGFAARARFPLAVAEASAEAWGGPVWMRLDPEESDPAGYGFEESIELAAALAGRGVELFDVAAPDYFGGSLRDPEDRRPRAALLEAAVGRPAVAVGGLATVDDALAARRDGCSLVGLGRVLLAEPDWPRRARAGEAAALATDLDSDARLEDAAVPRPVIEYLRRKPAERRIRA